MNLKQQPKRLAIIGAGAIGCEFADFYNAIGTQVTLIEMLDHLLPIEDEDCSIVLERSFTKRGIQVMTKTRTDKIEKTATGVKLTVSNSHGGSTIEADKVLVAIGVMGNIEEVIGKDLKLETFKNHIKVDKQYRTNLENIWAVGDVIGPPWLAHVAHHEAVGCIETIAGLHAHAVDYDAIPGCTYTHPQVASMGMTEKKARETGKQLRIGKFPFSVSGRALAAGETEGFVKLIFDAKYGELLGVHMIGENVTELLSELVLAKTLEGTEEEILSAMHPHPTLSEAIMEAAGVAVGRAIHI
jgi:dihydrolipoamide dehydrogenase